MSRFKALHLCLEHELKVDSNDKILPALPWSGWRRSFAPRYIQEMSSALNEYLQVLLTVAGLSSANALRTFVQAGRGLPILGTSIRSLSESPCRTHQGGLHLSLVVDERDDGWMSRKQRLALQGNQCAGCGTLLFLSALGLLSGNCRLCEYTGFLFCKRCHAGDRSILPAQALQKWSFTKYSVSKVAKQFLDAISMQPVLCVSAINPKLFRTLPPLRHVQLLRLQLGFLQDFVNTCRQAQQIMFSKLGFRKYLMLSTEMYSLDDLWLIDTGELPLSLMETVETLALHVTKDCSRCMARGFLCELCDDPVPIFSFDILNTVQCRGCKSFFHRQCWLNDEVVPLQTCPKCIRLKQRQREAYRNNNIARQLSINDELSRGSDLSGRDFTRSIINI